MVRFQIFFRIYFPIIIIERFISMKQIFNSTFTADVIHHEDGATCYCSVRSMHNGN